MPNQHASTITALATAPGKAGVAVIRLSGPNSQAITAKLIQKNPPPVGKWSYCTLFNQRQQLIDTALVLSFKAPKSFTGEDVNEFHCHGSPVIVETLLSRLYELGAEPAGPGEFSQRAFINGKIDLLQAEAIMDLIQANSIEAARAAQATLNGQFSQFINDISEQLIQLRASIELSLDFPDEQEDFIDTKVVSQKIQTIKKQLKRVINQANHGKVLTEATQIVIAGPPNVGKSTLLNQLSRQQRAIVSDIAGTTRDSVDVEITIEGVPIQLIDTAGIHQADNPIEQEGIRRSEEAMQNAQIILWVCDDANPEKIEASQLAPSQLTPSQLTPSQLTLYDQQKVICVHNKCDVFNLEPCRLVGNDDNQFVSVRISAKLNLGIELIRQVILEAIRFTPKESTFSARSRHIKHLESTHQYLLEAEQNLNLEPELSAESIQLAHQQLQWITGQFNADDLLGEIFGNFCIGK